MFKERHLKGEKKVIFFTLFINLFAVRVSYISVLNYLI